MSVARPNCTICADPTVKAQVEGSLGAGASFEAISRDQRSMGRAMKSETVSAHFRGCMDSKRPAVTLDVLEANLIPGKDFALLVRDKAIERLEAGDMRLSANHGLTAQGLLDRRAEKQADREFALNLARLLSGAVVPPPPTIIDGRAVEVTPRHPDGLAPEGVYEPRD